MFTRREIFPLVLSIAVMSLGLAFNDQQPTFEWGYWLSNFFVVLLAVAVSFVIHQVAHKIVARRHGFDTEYQLWGVQSFSWRPKSPWKAKERPFPRTITLFGKKYLINAFPIGIVLSLLVTFISNGALFFLAVGQYALLLKRHSRFGRKYIQVTGYEEAKIALVGPLSHVVLMVLASFFNTSGTFHTFVFVNAALAIFYMIPVHNLDGAKVLFGSQLLYIATLIFVLASVILVFVLPPVPMLIISAAASLVGLALYYYFNYFK